MAGMGRGRPSDRVVIEADERVACVKKDGAKRQGYLFTQAPWSVWIHCPAWARSR